jgi:hypothetical protein
MMAYHGLKNTDGDMVDDTEDEDKSSGKEPPLKKRKKSTSGKFSRPLLLLKWLVGSYRPLSILQDPGFKELLGGIPENYSIEDILRFANTKVDAVKEELHLQLKNQCDYYSVSYETFFHGDRTYCSVRITFCSPFFERKTYTIKVAPTPTEESPTTVIGEALKEYGLAVENISTLTPKEVTQDIHSSLLGMLGMPPIDAVGPCILNNMDSVVFGCLASEPTKQLLATIKSHVNNPLSGKTDLNIAGSKDVYQMIEEFLSLPTSSDTTNPTAQQHSMAKALNAMLQPFYDARKTILGDPYPMMTIPVFRRINDVLTKVDIKDYLEGIEATSMEILRQELSASFSKTFSTILDGSSPFMWTIPLDPRLSHMKGLSQQEKEKIINALVGEVKQLKLSSPNKNDKTDSGRIAMKSDREDKETSTMAGLFLGEDGGGVEEKKDNEAEVAASYARVSVDRYFDAVRSNSSCKILDPSTWWDKHKKKFPELAILARKWLGASTIYADMAGTRHQSDVGRENYSGDSIDLVCFLHDNSNLF